MFSYCEQTRGAMCQVLSCPVDSISARNGPSLWRWPHTFIWPGDRITVLVSVTLCIEKKSPEGAFLGTHPHDDVMHSCLFMTPWVSPTDPLGNATHNCLSMLSA